MIITTPMYAIADGLPVRYIEDDEGRVRSEYLNLTDGVWVDDFDLVYNVLNGREPDEPTELLRGDLILMTQRIFEDRVASIMKKRAKKLGIPYVEETSPCTDKELLAEIAAGPKFMPEDFDPDFSQHAEDAMDAVTAAEERAWYVKRGFPVPDKYKEEEPD